LVELEAWKDFGGGLRAAHGVDFDDGELELFEEGDGLGEAVALDSGVGADGPLFAVGGGEGEEEAAGH
jgi:hypothetical protein